MGARADCKLAQAVLFCLASACRVSDGLEIGMGSVGGAMRAGRGVRAEAVWPRGRWAESQEGLLEGAQPRLSLDTTLLDDDIVQLALVVALPATTIC